MIKINQRKKSNMSDLHKTSIPIRLKNQNLIFCTSLVIFLFSVFFFCIKEQTLIMSFRCPSYKSLVPYVCMSCVTAWALHAGGLSVSLSLLPFLFLPFLSLVSYLAPLCFSALQMLVLLSVFFFMCFLPVSLFLSVQGMFCSRWLRSTDRYKCSSRRWFVFWAQRVFFAQHCSNSL